MLRRLLRRLPRTGNGVRIYAVGDIHGRDDLLARLHVAMGEDAAAHPTEAKRIVYLGDMIDRGQDSRAVVDRLLESPIPGAERIVLMGNHEECLLSFLNDIAIGPAWFAFGGIATLQSYGVEPPGSMAAADLVRVQRQLRAALPERHYAFFRQLRLTHEEGDYLFVHAGIRPGIPLTAQSPEDLLWIREPFLGSEADFGKIVVHGHTIAADPVIRPNRIGIDTGAFRTGKLTCLVLSGKTRHFLQAHEKQ